ncbi:UdgX family uracil-DNA binding protein [Granulicella paludicola]|uniref:UdgX family uracil-DNA binding protein n=1 Tax=Granulicella paludicola TaxID=474951 RepID=UPI0021E07102|nr:UdgX family uracil-DNA binding protein [Granulicella paludicola]
MRRVEVAPTFEAWREVAREALKDGYRPEEINLADATVPVSGLLTLQAEDEPQGAMVARPHVPKEFLERARSVAAHREARRWNLLYRVLWRLQSERRLLRMELDADVAEFGRLEQQVRRDLHKMHAFVRFRRIVDEDGEQFVAWHEPDHRIVPLAAPFFAERFAVMRWAILTPDECVSWRPETKELIFGPGVPRETAPQADELEGLWRSYYGAIFNPARVNPKAMRAEMPVRYWKNLPELTQLPNLMQKAESRVQSMMIRQSRQPTAAPFVPEEHTLTVLREALPRCEGCDLFRHATQVVPGAGAAHAALMLVGEQPGDQEDLQGEPFIGPAGAILRRAMEELGIDAEQVYVTNAVKHFKFVSRGKFRLHQNPKMSEISACRPWLLAEIDAVKPSVILCLGASAAKSLLGGTFALMKQRGEPQESTHARHVYATVHPSAVLRGADEEGRAQLYAYLKADLATAWAQVLKCE